jgi:hypothetical protein
MYNKFGNKKHNFLDFIIDHAQKLFYQTDKPDCLI